jgi:hypothetical protein
MSDMSEGRRTPREDDGWKERKAEPVPEPVPESVPVDVERQERQLEAAGWERVERLGKRVWRHPESGHLYPQGPAFKRLRIDRGGS